MLFPDWVPVTDGFGYTGEANSLTYSGRWIAPYTVNNLTLAREMVDPKKRFAAKKSGATTYDHKAQIEHNLIPRLTAQKMSIKPLGTYRPNALNPDGTSVDLNSGKNTLDNVDLCEISIEWMLEPTNGFGLNCARVLIQGDAEFVELAESTTIVSLYSHEGLVNSQGSNLTISANGTGGNFRPLTKPEVRVDSKDTITVEYDWVDRALVNLGNMTGLRGSLNFRDTSIWAAGTLLYLNSDVEESVSPMGYDGFKVTHHFQSKPQDWNLVDAPIGLFPSDNIKVKYPGVTSRLMAWSQISPTLNANGTIASTNNVRNQWQDRSYQYGDFGTTLFFYGISSKAPSPPATINT